MIHRQDFTPRIRRACELNEPAYAPAEKDVQGYMLNNAEDGKLIWGYSDKQYIISRCVQLSDAAMHPIYESCVRCFVPPSNTRIPKTCAMKKIRLFV